jgi:hypothetical protein
MGSNHDKAWRLFDAQDFHSTVLHSTDVFARAKALASRATTLEKALIDALCMRFPVLGTTWPNNSPLNRAYADAMRMIYRAYPENLNIAALFVEALMCMTPRALWELDTGDVTGPHTTAIVEVIDRAFLAKAGRLESRGSLPPPDSPSGNVPEPSDCATRR